MTSATAAPRTVNVTPSVLADLTAILGADNVLHNRDETLVYECDGYMVERSLPHVVVFPSSTQHVVEVV
jgi:glycolate oxidase